MNIYQLIPTIAVLSVFVFCIHDFRRSFFPKFLVEKPFQHFTFLLLLGLFFLWSAQASVKEGLTIHFLGLTSLTLVYGWRVAFILTVPVTAGLVITQQVALNISMEYLFLSCLVPITISALIFYLTFRYLPKNIFVYIFIAGFFNAALSGSLHLMGNAGYQLWKGDYDWVSIRDNYLVFLPLLLFPEGLLNGMAAAILSVYKPEWLRTFSDKHYIYDHHRK
jgi:uncharacterized membrane protein